MRGAVSRSGSAGVRTAAAGVLLLAALVALPSAQAPAAASPAPEAKASRALNGTFLIQAGSYFRMKYPTGNRYFRNPDSSARDKTYTSLRGGTAGGLVTGTYQGQPRRGFDSRGNSLASSIIRPAKFAGINFGLGTFTADPQSRRSVPRPSFNLSGTTITGQTTAVTAAWNKQYFNQGAPKPGAGGTVRLGAYNPKNRRYVLTWSSRIKGGPFNGFTGIWRLIGTFRPR